MALIAPIAGAAVGGLLTGGATWGLAAGWLVGSWLFQPGNDASNTVFDPGAEEIPRFNQALRGVTIPILFGTNRVSSQVVWQKNFTTIRHESTQGGGGGKGGGSGMGAKGGGPGTTQATYEYKWDLLMHIGMADEDISLFGGWLGSERLNGDTLLAIINNSNSGFGSGIFRSAVNRPQNASLVFDEGFYHGAQATGDANAVNWAHFETQEGQPHRFPYTCYVGFKQLNLGAHAVVPQISWEVGPGEVSMQFSGGFRLYGNSHTTGGQMGNRDVIRGDDGKIYAVDHAFGLNVFKLFNVTDNVEVITYTNTAFDLDATTLGLDPGNQYGFTDQVLSTVIADRNYILAGGLDVGLASRSNWAFILYKINSSGSLTAIGGYQGRHNNLLFPFGAVSSGIFGEQTDDDAVLIWSRAQSGALIKPFILSLPSINEMLSVLVEDTAANEYAARLTDMTSVAGIENNFMSSASYRPYRGKGWGCIVPTVSIGLLGPIWGSKILFFIGKSDIEWHIDNPASASGTNTIYNRTVLYPFGGIFSVEITAANDNGVTFNGSLTDESVNFIDASSELTLFPGNSPSLKDSGFRVDGATVDDADDYDPSGMQSQKLTMGAAAGANIIMFIKNVSSGGDRDPTANTWTRIQAFVWNPLTQQAKRYVDQQGAFANTGTDWGIGAASNYTIEGCSVWFDETGEQVYISGSANGDGATSDIFVSTLGTFSIGGGTDLVPPVIIYRILTSTVFGFGIPVSAIDTASYQLAINYCDAEGIKCSVQYLREESKLSAINDLLALYGGYLIDSSGTIKFGLTTFADGTYGSVIRTIDNNHLVVDESEAPVRVTRGARQDTYNKVKVNYFDRDLEYRQNFVEISDEVDIDLHGTRAQEFPAKFVMSEQTANKLAVRALWSNLYTRDVYEFKLGPKDADLEPGDVITLVDSFHPKLQSGKQVRIVAWSEREPLKFDVLATDDVQYASTAVFSPDNQQMSTQNNLFGPALPAADFTMYELPKEFQGANSQVYVGYRQQSLSKGARLYTSADGVSFAQVQETQPFIISGIIADQMPNRDRGYTEENITVYLMPDTATGNWAPSSGTWAQTFQLDDVGAAGRAVGAGLFWINSEMLAYEGVNLIGQNTYRMDKVYRGWGGTHIQAHGSGDTFHKHGGGIFTQAYNEDKIGTIVHYKVAPFNFSGLEYNVASVDARTYQIQGVFFKPQNPPPLRTFVQSPGSFLTVQSQDLGFVMRKQVVSGGSPVQFEWPESARTRGYGARGYGNGGYGRFEQDTSSVQWRVEVLSNNLSTVVRCTTVNTPIYNYAVDTNSTDFSGWNGSFAVRVTPFNEFGTALVSRTKILELF